MFSGYNEMIFLICWAIWSILGFWGFSKYRLIKNGYITLGDLFMIIIVSFVLGPLGFIIYLIEKGIFNKHIFETRETREYNARMNGQIREAIRRREHTHIPEDTFRIE
jgi:hypothetical protein